METGTVKRRRKTIGDIKGPIHVQLMLEEAMVEEVRKWATGRFGGLHTQMNWGTLIRCLIAEHLGIK